VWAGSEVVATEAITALSSRLVAASELLSTEHAAGILLQALRDTESLVPVAVRRSAVQVFRRAAGEQVGENSVAKATKWEELLTEARSGLEEPSPVYSLANVRTSDVPQQVSFERREADGIVGRPEIEPLEASGTISRASLRLAPRLAECDEIASLDAERIGTKARHLMTLLPLLIAPDEGGFWRATGHIPIQIETDEAEEPWIVGYAELTVRLSHQRERMIWEGLRKAIVDAIRTRDSGPLRSWLASGEHLALLAERVGRTVEEMSAWTLNWAEQVAAGDADAASYGLALAGDGIDSLKRAWSGFAWASYDGRVAAVLDRFSAVAGPGRG
jgi:hypothetical protein